SDELIECFSGLEFIETAAGALGSLANEPAVAAEPVFAPQARLGDYSIIPEIGRGGMGVGYEAQPLSLAPPGALKVLPFAAAVDLKQRQRFQIEAQAAAQLHHSHIVPVFGVGCDRGIHYYAMQLVDGRSLAAIIRDLRHGEGKVPGLGEPSASG